MQNYLVSTLLVLLLSAALSLNYLKTLQQNRRHWGKTEPNLEKILKLKPDVILGSTKFPPATIKKLDKVQTTIPVSHVSSDWESNLLLLGELTGKSEEAKSIISDYQKDLKQAKETLKDKSNNKTAVILRIRQGDLYVYPEDVYFNSTLYGDLGFTTPSDIKKPKHKQ